MIHSFGDTTNRPHLLSWLHSRRNQKILDVGGAMHKWADKYVSAYLDILPVEGKLSYLGDACSEAVWKDIGDKAFDVTICTHTLEDLRDADYVIRQLQRVSRCGIIAVPNKHTEVHPVENPAYIGYCHHRWIFSIQAEQNKLTVVAKWPGTNGFLSVPPGWLDRSKLGGELWFIWEDRFDVELVDFPGWTCEELLRTVTDALSRGV